MFNASMPSLADIAAVTGNKNNDGFADGNGWWVLIILFALFGGWGNNGYGNRNGNGDSAPSVVYMPGPGMSTGAAYTDSAMQRSFDNLGVTNALSSIQTGICDLGYNQLAQMNNLGTSLMQTGYGLQNAIQQSTVNNMQNTNALQTQLANCCCENREAIAQTNYNMATDTCAITTAINQASQNAIQNCNANYRALHDELVQSQLDAKDAKIAEQQGIINALNLTASQQAQNNYLVSTLRPTPIPAYEVSNPYYTAAASTAATFANLYGSPCANC